MPVGKGHREQRLVKVIRRDATHFEEEDLGGVKFVPLIGEHGWTGRTATSA
jgi:protein-L-isoaspartate O-methyltransferase